MIGRIIDISLVPYLRFFHMIAHRRSLSRIVYRMYRQDYVAHHLGTTLKEKKKIRNRKSEIRETPTIHIKIF